jgi:hypothetical protein
MIHQCESLSLRFKPGDYAFGVHPQLNDFLGRLAAEAEPDIDTPENYRKLNEVNYAAVRGLESGGRHRPWACPTFNSWRQRIDITVKYANHILEQKSLTKELHYEYNCHLL